MDRFDSSVEFLNQNQDFPKNDNAFINFLIYVSIIRDGINNVFKVFIYIIHTQKIANAIFFRNKRI